MIKYNTKRYWGYSTEIKPKNAQIGDRFLEIDTNKEYFFSDYNNWTLITTGGGSVSGDYLPLSGGTVSGATRFTSGLTANTISATTYQNLPTDIRTTGATYSSNTFTFRNNTGGTYNVLFNTVTGLTANTLSVTGNTTLNGLTASTISATTYQNLPTDIFTTGATYSSNTFTFTNNTGGTFNVLFNTVTGLTANTLSVTGNTFLKDVSANTLFVSALTQTSGITSTGGITFKQVEINSSYTATTSDYVIDVTGGTFTVTLPSAIGIQGRLLIIKNNGGGAVTVQPISGQTLDDKPYLILSETNSIQIASNGSSWVIIGQDRSTVNNSSGVFQFSGLSKVSSTQFSVAPVKGWIVDDTTNPLSPQILYVAFTGGTYTDNYISSSNETYVYLTSGGTIQQQSTLLTPQQRRQNIFLGKLGHPDKTTINFVFSQPDFVMSPLSQLRDMFVPINLINGGVYPSANTGLTFNTTAGYLYGLGINYVTNTLSPNTIYLSGNSPCTFQYRTQTGGTIVDTTTIDPTFYDVGGVKTLITGNKATNQRIYLLQNGTFRIQYGQVTYNQLVDAIASIQSESFVTFPNYINNATLIGVLSILSSCTDLTDTSKAKFFLTSKFGETVGAAGGVSTTTLQQAYNNSAEPEIITNSTLDGFTIRRGSASDSDNLIVFQNGSGSTVSSINALGQAIFQNVSASTISATTYQNLPTDIFTTGATYSNNTFTYTNNTGGIFNVLFNTLTGLTVNGNLNVTGNTVFTSGLTASTISATTYQNLPTDIFTTGATYSSNTFTFRNNTGGTFNVLFNAVTGLTANTLSVTGNTTLNGLTASTISATTYQNLPIYVSAVTEASNAFTIASTTGNTNFTVDAVTGGSYNSLTGTITLSGTGAVNGNTISGLGSGGLTWQFATSSITASTNNGYITTGTTSIALPTGATLGSVIEVVSSSSNLFTITQNTNQFIRFGIVSTTPTSGTLVSQNIGDSVRLLCTSANTVFTVVSAVGVLTLN